MSVSRHREQHLPSFLRVYGASAPLPTAGELHAELQRLYMEALDNLALAQSGTLIDVDDAGTEHRKVSPTSIARAISEARKTLDSITRLAADAADEKERPMGLAQGELSERVSAQLRTLLARQVAPTHSSSDGSSTPVLDAPESEEHGEGEAGEVVVVAPRRPSYTLPLDAAKAVSTLPGIASRPVIAELIEADAQTRAPLPGHDDTVVMMVPNTRYPGSQASSPEERAAAGYPDISLTLEDLKASATEVAELVARRRSPEQ